MNIVIDCDAGMDDAVAIALAAAARTLTIDAITTVAGNCSVATTTANSLATVEALGLEIPVYRGAAGPDDAAQRYGTVLWGGDGGLGLPSARNKAAGDAIEYLTRRLEGARPGSVTLCPIGPLTNLAILFDRRPDLVDRVARLIVMGGAFHGGNVTAHAEFNIWFDPPAAKRVFETPCPAVIVPYDLTRHIVVNAAAIARLARATTPAAVLSAKLLPLAGSENHPSSIHDAATIGWLLWPDLFDSAVGVVSVVADDGDQFGRTLLQPDPDGRHRVLTAVDRDIFIDRMVETLGNGT
jgi:purine nucleosidase